MSREKTDEELLQHKAVAIQSLDTYIKSLISCEDPKTKGKADKLSYWIQDWSTFLNFETQFSPLSLRRYKRGEIIKVHLGFNIGSEEGGLHYAVVLDKNNAKSSPVVTIIPLTSVKNHTDISKLKSGNIFLGNEIFTNLNSKISFMDRKLKAEICELQTLVDALEGDDTTAQMKVIDSKLEVAVKESDLLDKMRSEISKMKRGSIALINQITTVSKIRIYDPKTDHDILSGIKLSNEKLDLIDGEIIKKYTNG